jgi:hypothetical protein
MIEAEWLACDDPWRMLRHLESTTSDRKMRLFECACARRVWYRVNDERLDRVLLGMENFADGLISAQELEPLHNLAWEIEEDDNSPSPSRCIAYELGIASRVKQPNSPYMDNGPIHTHSGRFSAALAASGTDGQEEFQRRKAVERKQQTVLLHDIFGNPFRPVTFSPAWRTDTALSLARQMYESREFGAMPILADALQDAGCDSEDILNHCRATDATHVRGCWVVDLVLGKK